MSRRLALTNARLLDQTEVNVPFRVKLDHRLPGQAGDLPYPEAGDAR